MSLVGYIWNKWGSVPSSPGKPARASRGCLVDSRLGVFSPSSVDWCWGTLPPHTSAQKYKCSALILQFITDQLLICINLSSAGGQKSSLRPLFFHCWLVWRGRDHWTGGIFFTQPGFYTKACPLYYSLKLILLHLAEMPLFINNGAAVRQQWRIGGWWLSHGQVCLAPEVPLARVADWGQDGAPLLFQASRFTLWSPLQDGSGAAQHAGPPGLGKPSTKPVPGSQGCTCHYNRSDSSGAQ